jgi:lysophospholipase L1-like esterase
MQYLVALLILLALGCPLLAADGAAEPPAPAVADPATYLAAIRAEMQKTWPKNRLVNVVCHGHSVPAGYFRTPVVDSPHAYPHLLFLKLKEHYPHAVVNVIVTAIGGENAVSGAARFERDVLSLRPDVVTIDYALNDRGVGLPAARAAWVSMITQAQARNIPVILLTPTPDQGARLDDPNDPINQHAQQIRDLAAQYHVGLVDSLAAFKARIKDGIKLADLMSQGNHPNTAGHEIVADALLPWFWRQNTAPEK